MKMKMMKVMMIGLIAVFLMTGCGAIPGLDTLATPPVSNSPSAANLLPSPVGFTRFEAQRLQDYIVSLGEAGTALLGQFEATAVIAMIDGVANCYQDLGVVAAAGYSRTDMPVVAGVVAVSNRDRLLDPATFLACIGMAQQPQTALGQGGGGLQPCSYAYTIELSGDTYDILYAGTDMEACQAFCRLLPGCTGH